MKHLNTWSKDLNTCVDNDLAQSQQYVYEKCLEDQVGKVHIWDR